MAQTITPQGLEMSADAESETTPIRHVQTVGVRHNTERNDYRITATAAVKAANLGAGAMFRFKPDRFGDLGMIPVLGAPADEDIPRDRNTRTATTDGKGSIRIALPGAVIETLTEQANVYFGDSDSPSLLDVFAGDRLLALAPAEGIDIPVSALPADPDRVLDDNRKQVRLKRVQNTRPRVKVGKDGRSRMAEVTITQAIRRAGIEPLSDQSFSVSYHPELAGAFRGVVPAVGYRRGADVHDPEYAIYRDQGAVKDASGVYSVGIPDEVLAGLGTSMPRLEELDRAHRPQITVYAGDGVLGFKPPTVREIAIGRGWSRDLTDLDGIGEAIATRLRDQGFDAPAGLEAIGRKELLDVEGIGTERADRILASLYDRGVLTDRVEEGSTDSTDRVNSGSNIEGHE